MINRRSNPSPHVRTRARTTAQRGFIVEEIFLALMIVVILTTVLAISAGQQTKGLRDLTNIRRAARIAEESLLALESGAALPAVSQPDSRRVAILEGTGSPPGFRWVEISVHCSAGAAKMIGLVPSAGLQDAGAAGGEGGQNDVYEIAQTCSHAEAWGRDESQGRGGGKRGFLFIELLVALELLAAFSLVATAVFIGTLKLTRQANLAENTIGRFDPAVAQLRIDVWAARSVQVDSTRRVRMIESDGRTFLYEWDGQGTLKRTNAAHPGDDRIWQALPGPLSFESWGSILVLRAQGESIALTSQPVIANAGGAQ